MPDLIEKPASDLATDIRCLSCGYSLRGLASPAHCPECGILTCDSLHPSHIDPIQQAPEACLITLETGFHRTRLLLALHYALFACLVHAIGMQMTAYAYLGNMTPTWLPRALCALCSACLLALAIVTSIALLPMATSHRQYPHRARSRLAFLMAILTLVPFDILAACLAFYRAFSPSHDIVWDGFLAMLVGIAAGVGITIANIGAWGYVASTFAHFKGHPVPLSYIRDLGYFALPAVLAVLSIFAATRRNQFELDEFLVLLCWVSLLLPLNSTRFTARCLIAANFLADIRASKGSIQSPA